jgi:hypothetical protein
MTSDEKMVIMKEVSGGKRKWSDACHGSSENKEKPIHMDSQHHESRVQTGEFLRNVSYNVLTEYYKFII